MRKRWWAVVTEFDVTGQELVDAWISEPLSLAQAYTLRRRTSTDRKTVHLVNERGFRIRDDG